LNINPNKG